MNPTELARKLEAIVIDYDTETALTAIKITELLLHHREAAKLAHVQQELSDSGESAR